jgi:hypothetical protein
MIEIVFWTPVVVAATGIAAGLAHALGGPDHLAAVAPLALSKRRHRWASGALWGLGHSTGVWLLGLVLVFMRDLLPIASISSWSERLVGVALIGMGLWGMHKVLAGWVHAHEHVHEHVHGGEKHLHLHIHWPGVTNGESHRGAHRRAGFHSHAALGIGVLHGLTGGSFLLGILPSLVLPSKAQAIGYLAAFGFGSIIGMAAFSWVVGLVAEGLASARIDARSWLLTGSSVMAIMVGSFWLFL